MTSNPILTEDVDRIVAGLRPTETTKLEGATVLLTGCAGFLGFYFLHVLAGQAERLGVRRIIGLDNFMRGRSPWLARLAARTARLDLHQFDIIDGRLDKVPGANDVDLVIHMASIASPTFYRQFPIETLDANVWGLRALLDFYRSRPLRGFLFFSSSEIYGDPPAEFIPTKETYRGNVPCIGPRACYDESKRFGETMCQLFAEKHAMPIAIARPFNNYGPGMSLDDGRVPADFAKAVMEGRDIEILSDGMPTRTFCYISDAIVGYLKVLCHGRFEVFNIGIETPEITIRDLADIFCREGRRSLGYVGQSSFGQSADGKYLVDNPSRRCPDIAKARQLLGFDPVIDVKRGVGRFLDFLKSEGARG